MTNTVSQAIDRACEQLEGHVEDPRTDSQSLYCSAFKVDRGWLISHANDELSEAKQILFDELIERRGKGEPVAYISGQREFWSLRFKVSPDTLIPRPETELLVEESIQLDMPDKGARLLDFGTGSGAIAIAIAVEQPGWYITGVDISAQALEVARENAKYHEVDNVRFIESDSLKQLGDAMFDIIVSNPPYVAEDDPHLSQGDLRFEPHHALISGKDGLDCIRKLVSDAREHLAEGGYLLMEHGYDQGEVVRQLLKDNLYQHIDTIRDLAGHERVTMARWKSK